MKQSDIWIFVFILHIHSQLYHGVFILHMNPTEILSLFVSLYLRCVET